MYSPTGERIMNRMTLDDFCDKYCSDPYYAVRQVMTEAGYTLIASVRGRDVASISVYCY
jgi:hypothetical protein